MSTLHGWILGAVGVAFLAGLAAGLLVGRLGAAEPADAGPLGAYREALVREFDLDPERERALFSVLDVYRRKLEDLAAAGLAEYEDELISSARKTQVLIRDFVLPESERDRFDALQQARPLPGQG